MNVQKTALLIVLGVLSVIGFIYISFDEKEESILSSKSENMEIVREWKLPEILDEISGIAMIDEERIAAVQDENGIIFIYNLSSSEIEEQIEFGDDGDYEGIALSGTTAYVLRSDGNIFEVQNYRSQERSTIIHKNGFEGNYNFEGLFFDDNNNSLLLAVKEVGKEDDKPVYSYDPSTRELQEEPVFTINSSDPIFKDVRSKKTEKVILPSEINIHPSTGNIYLLDAVNPKIVILSGDGDSQNLYQLNKKQFSQAEGLTFGPGGELYISNEGKGGKANILQVKLDVK